MARSTPRAITPAPCIGRLEEAIVSGRRYFGAETAHELRVSAGRLRAWLGLAGLRVLDDDLRLLRSALAWLRDLDVQIEAAPPGVLSTWLAWQRAAARHAARSLLLSPEVEGLVQALRLLPARPAPGRQPAIRPLWRGVLDAGQKLERAPQELATQHLLRRRVRRLRYALDWLEGPTGRLQHLQERLGEAQELARRLVVIEAFRKDPEAGPHPDVEAYAATTCAALRGALGGAAGIWAAERTRLRRELSSWMSS